MLPVPSKKSPAMTFPSDLSAGSASAGVVRRTSSIIAPKMDGANKATQSRSHRKVPTREVPTSAMTCGRGTCSRADDRA
eukprot:2903179-Pleurochrysis_carterae.AAC.1